MTDIGVTTYHLSQVDVVAQCGCNADLQQGVEVVDDNGEQQVQDATCVCNVRQTADCIPVHMVITQPVFVTAVGQRLQLFHVDSQQRTLLPSLSSSVLHACPFS